MSVQDMISTLDTLNQLHQSLLELAGLKQAALTKNDVEALSKIAQKENRLVKEIGEADSQRLAAIEQYLMKRGYRMNPSITVSDLIKIIFRPEEKEALAQAQRGLLDTLRELKVQNDRNQQLIEQSLSFINYSLDVIVGPPEEEGIYHMPSGHSPSTQRNNRRGMFDTKA